MLKTRRHSSKNKKSMREKGMEKEKTTSKRGERFSNPPLQALGLSLAISIYSFSGL